MKKRLIAWLALVTLLVVGVPFVGLAAEGETDTNKETGHYLWTFEDDARNDNENGVYTADTDNNKLTVKTVENPVFPENAIASGIEAKAFVADSEAAVKNKLGRALYAAGVYFELENPINMRHDAEWMITLVGRLPNGSNGTNNPNLNADTAMFAGDDCEFFIDGNGTAMSFTKTVDGTETRYRIRDEVNWQNSYRIGQNRKQMLQIWNQYNQESGKWEIHWVTKRYDGSDTWEDIECHSDAINGLDFVFKTVGSESNYFDANTWGNEKGKFAYAYLTKIEVYENLATYNKTVIDTVAGTLVNNPLAGIAFTKTVTLDPAIADSVAATVTWTDAEGNQKTKAVGGNTYTATIRLTPMVGFAFTSDTTVPEGWTKALEADGSLILTRSFSVAKQEEPTGEEPSKPASEAPSAEPTKPIGTDSGKAENEPEARGCASALGAGTAVLLLTAALGLGLLRRKNKAD